MEWKSLIKSQKNITEALFSRLMERLRQLPSEQLFRNKLKRFRLCVTTHVSEPFICFSVKKLYIQTLYLRYTLNFDINCFNTNACELSSAEVLALSSALEADEVTCPENASAFSEIMEI